MKQLAEFLDHGGHSAIGQFWKDSIKGGVLISYSRVGSSLDVLLALYKHHKDNDMEKSY
jgi:hypothetical protein